MEGLLDEVGKLQKGPNLVQTAGHVDGIIDLLEDARRDIVDGDIRFFGILFSDSKN